MAFDQQLTAHVRGMIPADTAVQERKMFGGLAFLLHGNMSVGIQGADLVVRIEPSETEEGPYQTGRSHLRAIVAAKVGLR